MTIILAFTAASLLASTLVVSACALSSRLSRREGLEESYVTIAQPAQTPAKPARPFSVN